MSALSSETLLSSAQQRAKHFAQAVSWFADELDSNASFKSVFLKLVDSFNAADSSAKTSQHVHFVALGKSAGVAKLAVSMLSSVGIRAAFVHAAEAFHGDLGGIKDGDAVVTISNFGRTQELLEVIPHLRERRCILYALTSQIESPLARAVDFVLPIPSVKELCPLDQAPLTSTITTLALCQLLVAASMEARNFEIESYAKNHPGGAIGKRIFVRVDDVMTPESLLPLVEANTRFEDCISIMTKSAKACVVVVKNKKLLGLITEKDIRTVMQNFGAHAFEKTAVDFMNKTPITIASGTLATDAMRIMEKRARPISVLPVVDNQNYVLGLVHIHDLVANGITFQEGGIS